MGDRFRGSHGWSSALGRRSRVRGSVVRPFSHVAILLSCVPAHTLEIEEAVTPTPSIPAIIIHHTSASLEVAGLKRSWIRHTRDWHIRGDVGRRSVTDSVARVAGVPRVRA